MPLEDIPVRAAADQPVNAPALLREIAALLQQLSETGQGDAIDLRSLPMSAADRTWLRERLGAGEVTISLRAGGASSFEETGLAGVWWVEHRDEAGRLAAEFIEVAWVPAMVVAPPEDVKKGLDRLNKLISDLSWN